MKIERVLRLSFILLVISLLTLCDNSEELYKYGTITKAKVLKRRKVKFPRSGPSYDISIRFWHDSKRHTRLLSVKQKDYKRCYAGAEVDIIFLKSDMQVVELLDYKRFYKTEERILNLEDLIEISKTPNLDSIQSQLEKISYGWNRLNEGNIGFINQRREEVLIIFKDSISYYSRIYNIYEIRDLMGGKSINNTTKITTGLLNIPPFDTIPLKPIYKHGEISHNFDCLVRFKNNYEFNFYQQIDNSSKVWVLLNCKKRNTE